MIMDGDNIVNKFTKYPLIPLIDLISTYQGEGPNAGRKMVLSRFKYCNKKCPFCDTWKMMEKQECSYYRMEDIEEMLKSSPNLMITGGEPTIKSKYPNSKEKGGISQYDFTMLMAENLDYDYLDIETNGLHIIDLYNDISKLPSKNINISWSPKFISKEDYGDNIVKLIHIVDSDPLRQKHVTIKIVIGKEMDDYIRFATEAIEKYKFNSNNMYLMPEGVNLEGINNSFPVVLNLANKLHCNISSRLHVVHNFV